ncbi:MAG: response regulator [Alphaproteobacteria bacterium]|nr:response regulator [Alphaproteobacteria bacterium]
MGEIRGGAPRILIVEDEAVVRLALADALADFGYRVESAGTAQAALDLLAAPGHGVDAAILDVGLPDRPGDALAAELRARDAGLPIVIATGDDDAALRDRFAADPRVAFLGKPYAGTALAALLAALGVRAPDNRPDGRG